MLETEFRTFSLAPCPPTGMLVDVLKLGLRRTLDRLLGLERSDFDDWDDADEARRWRCILVGSTFGMFASLANNDRMSTQDTIPDKFPIDFDETIGECDSAESRVTKSLCALAAGTVSRRPTI